MDLLIFVLQMLLVVPSAGLVSTLLVLAFKSIRIRGWCSFVSLSVTMSSHDASCWPTWPITSITFCKWPLIHVDVGCSLIALRLAVVFGRVVVAIVFILRLSFGLVVHVVLAADLVALAISV